MIGLIFMSPCSVAVKSIDSCMPSAVYCLSTTVYLKRSHYMFKLSRRGFIVGCSTAIAANGWRPLKLCRLWQPRSGTQPRNLSRCLLRGMDGLNRLSDRG